MFFWGQKLKQHIMLGTDTHKTPNFVQLRVQVGSKNLSCTLGSWVETRQHRNRGSLASSIVTQQNKNLVAKKL
jgi:hypothetical protein